MRKAACDHDENAKDENAIIKHHPGLRNSARKSNPLDREDPRSRYSSKVASVPPQASPSRLSKRSLASNGGNDTGFATLRVPLSEIAQSQDNRHRRQECAAAGAPTQATETGRSEDSGLGDATILQKLMLRVDESQYERLLRLAQLNGTLADGLQALQVS